MKRYLVGTQEKFTIFLLYFLTLDNKNQWFDMTSLLKPD